MEDKLLYLSQTYEVVDNVITIEKILLPTVWSPTINSILKYLGHANVTSVEYNEDNVVITV